jgi:hypothetical protein
MATMTKRFLSGSTSGKGIKLTDTGTSGNTDAGYVVHQGVSGTTDIDEVWLWAVNSSSADVKLTVEWGEVAAPDGNIELTIPGESGLVPVVPGLLIQDSLYIKAFASSANVVMIHGFVNRMDY